MNELIKIEKSNVGGDLIETVNARELHQFLVVGKDFSNWIKNRIEQYDFVEGVDYLLHKFMEQLPSGAKQKIDYHISIDMAKELAMVERSDKGREARRYFIECEKRLKQVTNQPVPLLSEYEKDLKVIGVIAEVLRVSESSKLGMVKTYCEKHVSRVAPLLPSYAVDSPTGSTAGSSEPTMPISNVVEGIMSAAKANKALDKAGLLEQRFRKSSNGEKAFWSVTEKGLNYGKNITSPHNQRETQPHWYVSKKEDLVNIIKNNMQ